jgi:uncharacterized protein YndB with AHSA1/START domain
MRKTAETTKRATPKAGSARTLPPTPTVTVRREIDASAEELFDAWLDPDAIAQWMRPNGIESTTAVVDARVGGGYEIMMGHGSGPLLHKGVYQEIDRPRRLVFTWSARGPLEATSLVTVEFNRRGRLTEIVVTHEQLPGDDQIPAVNAGWSQAIERLVELFQEGRI